MKQSQVTPVILAEAEQISRSDSPLTQMSQAAVRLCWEWGHQAGQSSGPSGGDGRPIVPVLGPLASPKGESYLRRSTGLSTRGIRQENQKNLIHGFHASSTTSAMSPSLLATIVAFGNSDNGKKLRLDFVAALGYKPIRSWTAFSRMWGT
ncbi:hypothetical protein H8959_002338 [Pygathrix nigripes]